MGTPSKSQSPAAHSAVRSISLASDGRLLSLSGVEGFSSGGSFVHCWAGRKLTWSTPSDGWNYESALLDFKRSGGRLLVVRRQQADRRVELFDAANGGLVRSWPLADQSSRSREGATSLNQWTPGSILELSPDGQFAIVVGADVDTGNTVLDLWSLEELRIVRSLGSYPRPRGAAEVFDLQFSPNSRWLFIASQRQQGFEVEFWKLAPLDRIGTARSRGWSGISVDRKEDDCARIGYEIFDLATARRRCELEPVAMSPGVHDDKADLTFPVATGALACRLLQARRVPRPDLPACCLGHDDR